MKLADFMELSVEDLDRMNPEEVHAELKRAAGSLNRRYQNIRGKSRKRSGNVPSQEAVREVAKSGGRFGTKGTKKGGQYNIPAMRREFARMKKFYENPASTVKGAQKRAKDISEQWFGEGAEEGLTGGQLGELRQKENRAFELAMQVKELGGDKYKDVLYSIEKIRADAQRDRNGITYADIIGSLDKVIADYENELAEARPQEEESGLWAAKARRTKK